MSVVDEVMNPHRQFPIPSQPWVMKQTWNHVLFAHWPVSKTSLQQLLPCGLHLDTYNDDAWISVVMLEMNQVHMRGIPPIPGFSQFHQVNIRTYVTHRDKPGVYFLSLHANHPIVAPLARTLFFVPYHRAQIHTQHDGPLMAYQLAENVDPESENHKLNLHVAYRLNGEGAIQTSPDSITSWLTDRYCLFVAHGQSLYEQQVHHRPWSLLGVEGKFLTNNLFDVMHLKAAENRMRLHYSPGVTAYMWMHQKVD